MTVAERRASFEHLITHPIHGAKLPSETGLDDETLAAVQKVWDADLPPPALIAAARTEFARMVDGTHARATRAHIRALRDQLS